MKSIVVLFFTIFSVLMACNSSKAQKTFEDKPKLESDTIRISNEEIEYDVDGDLGGKVPFTAEVLPLHVEAYYY